MTEEKLWVTSSQAAIRALETSRGTEAFTLNVSAEQWAMITAVNGHAVGDKLILTRWSGGIVVGR